MKVSTRGDYASRALLSLALHGDALGPTSVRDIAERTGLPQPYLEQILLALKGAGLVRSKRGVGGGYVLARLPEDITLSEIVHAVDGPIVAGDFGRPHENGACEHEGQCILLAVWSEVGEHMREHLDSFTLADMVSRSLGNAPARSPTDRRLSSERSPVTILKWVVGLAGVVLVTADLYDLVRALVVPRPHTSGPVAVASRVVRKAVHAGVGRVSTFATRDHLLTTLEPVVMLLRLGIWLSAGLAGFALVIWSTGNTSFGHSFIEAGSSIFTLGFATESHPAPEVVAFLAASFGLLVIALQIAYLPALYDSFNRRETLVTMLESRAGTPAWGPELLARHYLVGIEGNLPSFYGEWERWSADVAESHTTYPALIYMRSPHPTNSWLVGLIAVLDSAALFLAVCPAAAPAEARLCVRMGFTCLRDIARAIRIPFDPDPRPDAGIELPFEDFVEAVARLEQAGVPLERAAEEAWAHFKGWRVNYESTAYALANIVFAPPGAWTGGRRYPEEATGAPSFPQRPVDRRPDKPEGDRVQSA